MLFRSNAASSHSTFEPVGAPPPKTTKAHFVSFNDVDQYTLRWKQGDASAVRLVSVPLHQTYLRVQDVGMSRYDQQWMQNWQLNPQWQVLPRETAFEPAAVHPSGLYLYGACWSGLYMRGSPQPVEAFPKWRTAVPATAFRCGGLGTLVKIDTLWIVSDVKGTLAWDRMAGTFSVIPDAVPSAVLAR